MPDDTPLADDASHTDEPAAGHAAPPVAAPAAEPGTERTAFRTALRYVIVLITSLAVVGAAVGFAAAGLSGLWGALVGAGLAGIFCTTTPLSMLATIGKSPATMAAVIMGAWLVKVIILIALLATIRDLDFYSPVVLFVVIAVGVAGSAVVDTVAMLRARLPYVTAG